MSLRDYGNDSNNQWMVVLELLRRKSNHCFTYIYKIGFRLKEVPVIFVNRVEGTSKMSGGIFGEAFFGVMRLRLDGWFRQYPRLPIV